jgi:hypothetical protein
VIDTPTLDQIARLAINRDWTVDVTDPRNAAYLIPFGNSAREHTAQAMADVVYGAIAEKQFTNSTPQIEADAVYFQCLVDARRMLSDPDYLHLISWEA